MSNELINKIINCYAKIVYLLKYLVSDLMAASCSLHCYKLRKCMCACSVYPMVVIERNCNQIARFPTVHELLLLGRGWRGGGVLTPLDPPLNPPLVTKKFNPFCNERFEETCSLLRPRHSFATRLPDPQIYVHVHRIGNRHARV